MTNKVNEAILQRTTEIAAWIIANKGSTRSAAAAFGISKSVVQSDLAQRLPNHNPALYQRLRVVMDGNSAPIKNAVPVGPATSPIAERHMQELDKLVSDSERRARARKFDETENGGEKIDCEDERSFAWYVSGVTAVYRNVLYMLALRQKAGTSLKKGKISEVEHTKICEDVLSNAKKYGDMISAQHALLRSVVGGFGGDMGFELNIKQ